MERYDFYFGTLERTRKTLAVLDENILIQQYKTDLEPHDDDIKAKGERLLTELPFKNLGDCDYFRKQLVKFYVEDVEGIYNGLKQSYL